MAKQAVIVKYLGKPGSMSRLLDLLKTHIARTKANEPGCLQFDILLPHDEADTLHLHEVYADEAAFDSHNASEHLAMYKASTEHLLLDRSIAWCTVEE